jgi:hypothetical protein
MAANVAGGDNVMKANTMAANAQLTAYQLA